MIRRTALGLFAATMLGSVDSAQCANVPRCPEGVYDPATVRAAVEAESVRQGADAKLSLAIVDQETLSGRNINAPEKLDKGARGPMQLMPGTAQRFGVKDVCDLAENVHGGVAYIKELSEKFGGNVLLVASAYNAGEGRVVEARGVPPLPETVRYAASVANIYYQYDNAFRGGAHAKSHAADVIAAHGVAGEAASQKWIGGSVLYVEGDNQ
jgi:soluble lytic murein transglycosylase-like protein